MGDARERGTREERVAAALAREDARRAAWADDMVADAAALLEAAGRYAKASMPKDAPEDAVAGLAHVLASLAAQRAVADDLVQAIAAEDPEEDEEELLPDPPARPGKPFSLVSPPKPEPSTLP